MLSFAFKLIVIDDVFQINLFQQGDCSSDFLCKNFSRFVFMARAQRIAVNPKRLKFGQRLTEIRQVLLVTDLVVINVEHPEILRLAFEALDLLNFIDTEVENPERRQLGQALNLLDLVATEPKLDQSCAPTEAFDGRD